MANGVCDICGVRLATVRAQVSSDGQRQTLELCDTDYRRLARQQRRPSSPLESLFGGQGSSLFDEVFGDGLLGGGGGRKGRDARETGNEGARRSIPVRAGRGRGGAAGTAGTAERLSSHAEEILQDAARHATETGRREVDTEHLMLALTRVPGNAGVLPPAAGRH